LSLSAWLPDWLTPGLELGRTQQFGLAFLLGSFTVAIWSDLKRLSAQREFVEIWLVFMLAMLGHDVWSVHVGGMPLERVGVKWGLIMLASILSLRPVKGVKRQAISTSRVSHIPPRTERTACPHPNIGATG